MMSRQFRGTIFSTWVGLWIIGVMFLAGCGRSASSPWRLVAENRSDKVCGVKIEHNVSGGGATVSSDLKPGSRSELANGFGQTTLSKVTVTLEGKEQILVPGKTKQDTPSLILNPGQILTVLIDAEGKSSVAVTGPS